MEEAERIAREEHGNIKLAVISGKCGGNCLPFKILYKTIDNVLIDLGVGTRDYYRKLGYELDGPYMSKSLL